LRLRDLQTESEPGHEANVTSTGFQIYIRKTTNVGRLYAR
jgi:hypothetical protein